MWPIFHVNSNGYNAFELTAEYRAAVKGDFRLLELPGRGGRIHVAESLPFSAALYSIYFYTVYSDSI